MKGMQIAVDMTPVTDLARETALKMVEAGFPA